MHLAHGLGVDLAEQMMAKERGSSSCRVGIENNLHPIFIEKSLFLERILSKI